MSTTSQTHATNMTNAAAYAQSLLDQMKADPAGIDPLVQVKVDGWIRSTKFMAKLFNNTALTAAGTVAGDPTVDASGGPGTATTNAVLDALLTAAG